MIVADLPYAHETVGKYCEAGFVNPDDPILLSSYMRKVIDGQRLKPSNAKLIRQPYAENWSALSHMLLGVDKCK